MSFQNDRMPARALALLDEARNCDDPTHADRARISAAMAPRLAALGVAPVVFTAAPLAAAPVATGVTVTAATTAAATTAGAATATGVGLGLGAKVAMVLVAASVAAGGTMYGLHARERASAPVEAATQARAAQTAAQPAAVPASNALAERALPSPAEARAIDTRAVKPLATITPVLHTRPLHPMRARFAATRSTTRAPSSVTSEPVAAPTESIAPAEPIDASLREELAIIARANTALRLEHPADALRALDEHARRFQAGMLSEERRGLRVLALCQLSPNQAALDARDAFLRTAPNALLAPKVRAACTKDAKGAR